MGYAEVLYGVEGRVATVTLNRPDKLNAWTAMMGREVRAAMMEAATDDGVRVIVLTGAGRGFCAGADMGLLSGLSGNAAAGEDAEAVLRREGADGAARGPGAEFRGPYAYFPTTLPVIAGLNGATAGPVSSCRSTGPALRGRHRRVHYLVRAPRPHRRARRLVDAPAPGGAPVRAGPAALRTEDRRRRGPPHRPRGPGAPHAAFMSGVLGYARELADFVSPRSMAVIKRQLWEAQFQGLAQATAVADEEMRQSFGAADFKEGVAAFLEKRAPRSPAGSAGGADGARPDVSPTESSTRRAHRPHRRPALRAALAPHLTLRGGQDGVAPDSGVEYISSDGQRSRLKQAKARADARGGGARRACARSSRSRASIKSSRCSRPRGGGPHPPRRRPCSGSGSAWSASGARGLIPVGLGGAAVRDKVVAALVAAAGRGIDTPEAARAFVEHELDFEIGHTYGGDSSCVEVRTGEDERVVCDLGSGARAFGNHLLAARPSGHTVNVFMSHVHWDHIMGFPFFMPAYLPGNHIRIHGCHPTLEAAFRRQHAAPSFPVDFARLGATIELCSWSPGATTGGGAARPRHAVPHRRLLRLPPRRTARCSSTPPTPSTSATTPPRRRRSWSSSGTPTS
jgi:enoyl-CoA hydratase/carnithine racemase